MMEPNRFLEVVAVTPLVSIDLIIRDVEGRVLLGERLNRPAQGYWFVPGGRIRKDERVADAMGRISRNEVALSISPTDATLIGVYDHLYPDNYLGRPGIGTHYVVLAYEYRLTNGQAVQPDDQHAELRFWKVEDLLYAANVHENTKAYFRD